jgi:phage tail-like protein
MMDPNGTRFHLLKSQADWQRCQEEPYGSQWRNLEWDASAAGLGLRQRLPRFAPTTTARLQPEQRRGAALDRFGNGYWLSHDRRQIIWQPGGSAQPAVYWAQTPPPTAPTAPGDTFQPPASTSVSVELAGLTVTEHHYLVVGNLSQGGVFVFDLQAGGEPLSLLFPVADFSPFDLAAAPGGGVWILDRQHRAYWGLDREFRIIAAIETPPVATPPDFQPPGAPPPPPPPAVRQPVSFAVAAEDPISIEALADGSVLILERLAEPAPSVLHHYRGAQPLSPPLPLLLEIAVADPLGGEPPLALLAFNAHDFVSDGNAQQPTLHLVDSAGKQVIAGTMRLGPTASLTVARDYLPLHAFGGRALIRDDRRGGIAYDLSGRGDLDSAVRWLLLQAIPAPTYTRAAVLLTPVFDGKTHDCVWDGLFLDGCLPPATMVRVASRADNDWQLLDASPFHDEPPLYQRGAGAELPFYDPFADRRVPAAGQTTPLPLPEGTGTWELLLQQAQGRYLQLRLELRGNGRATPQLHALRVYYPRFSYPRNYLPAVYREDRASADFLERLLANPRGFLSDIEARITAVSLLFDPQGAPPEALDWLASWVGLTLDPLWSELNRRRQPTGNGQDPPATDRRRLLIRFANRLYGWRGTVNGLLFALELLLDPCLEATLARLQRATLVRDDGLSAELDRLQLPYPSNTLSDADLEDLLFAYVVSPRRHAKVRLVERFRVRTGVPGVASVTGITSVTGDSSESAPTDAAFAHRFSVLIPEDLSAAESAMVQRIVDLEKPAHSAYDVRRYWDYFRVGEVRLGIDTLLGEAQRFVPVILGRQALAEGYLYPAPPSDSAERLLLNRDQLGGLPPL